MGGGWGGVDELWGALSTPSLLCCEVEFSSWPGSLSSLPSSPYSLASSLLGCLPPASWCVLRKSKLISMCVQGDIINRTPYPSRREGISCMLRTHCEEAESDKLQGFSARQLHRAELLKATW